MSQTQSTTKKFAVRTFATLAAMSVLLAPLAFAADQTMTGTVTAVNALEITTGGAMTLTPAVGVPAEDATTVLSFETNDGLTYKITVTAAVWAFTPSAGTAIAAEYPVLRFVSAAATAGTPSATAGELISAGNIAGTGVDVATEIKNMLGTATVTLDATVTQSVVAGAYATTLTYALVTP